MNDSLVKLLAYIEPKILDIQDKRKELLDLESSYKVLKEIIDLGENSYQDIINFYDQNFILNCIKTSNDTYLNNLDLYKSSKYLLKSNNQNLLELPQYKEAINYIEKLFTYLIELYNLTKKKYEDLKEELEQLEILNKYYLIFSKNNIEINDIDEFLLFLQLVDIPLSDKLNVLIQVVKFNVRTYTLTNDILLTCDIYLSNIIDTLEKEKDKIDNSLLDSYSFDDKIIFDDENNLILRQKYLITKLSSLYNANNYDELPSCYLLYLEVTDYLKEIEKQKVRYNKTYSKNLIFVRTEKDLLINNYLRKCLTKYRACVYKNLLDIESSNTYVLPDYKYNDKYFYLKKEFIVKVIYMYLDNGNVLIVGVLDKDGNIEEYISKNMVYIMSTIKNIEKLKDKKDRDLLLKDIKEEDLVLTIDLDTLDMEENYAR